MCLSCTFTASGRIIASCVRPWVLTRPGIRERQRGKIRYGRPHPLERGLEPLHGLLPRDGVEVVRVGPATALVRREAVACTLLHLVAQELEALADVDNPRLLRMPLDSQFLSEESLGDGPRPLGFFPRLTQHHEVIRPACEPEALRG